MTEDEAFKRWWYNEGSQAPYTHHDCEEHTMRMCEIAWKNGAYKEREACAKVCDDRALDFMSLYTKFQYEQDNGAEIAATQCARYIRARGEA